ncbi:MAG: chromate transporter [Spirochaetales bacterium]|nr:chromate transporter [Spirochaetales bacterium]
MSDAPAAEKKTSLWTLFITFAKVGVMTFGGGYAMLPILEREVVKNHNWTTSEQMLDYYAIGQCTPGIIAVNVSTFIGYKTRGILGAIVATFGMVFPSLVIITALASVLKMFQDNVYVKKAFAGIRIAVCALMVTAVIGLVRKAVSNIPTAIVAVAALLLQLLLGVSPVIIVICTVAFGLIMYFSTIKRNNDSENKEVQK